MDEPNEEATVIPSKDFNEGTANRIILPHPAAESNQNSANSTATNVGGKEFADRNSKQVLPLYDDDQTKKTDFLFESSDLTNKERMTLVANTFQTHRQIGEAEAFYKLIPNLKLKDSNVTTQ